MAPLSYNHIQVIDFSGTYVHDDAVVTVVQRCRALRVLHLRRCEYVSDDALWAISASAHELTELDIAYCSRVTEAGVSDMRCNKLQACYPPNSVATLSLSNHSLTF